jgi:hypothetical protein
MNLLGNILALTASDRFRATASWFHGSESIPPEAFIPLIVVVAVVIAGLAVFLWWRKKISQTWQNFHEQAARMGMTKAEQEIIRYVVKAEGLRNPLDALTAEGVFQQASAALVASEKFVSLDKDTKRNLTAIVKSAREKLESGIKAIPQQERFIDRRKFARIKTDRKAMVAPLPFVSDSTKLEGLQPVPGKLLEIAGPGFLIQVQGQFNVGEKVVVMVKLHDEQVISGVGKVRRVQAGNDGESSIGGELIDLGQEELSRMVRETHMAEQLSAAENQQTTAP